MRHARVNLLTRRHHITDKEALRKELEEEMRAQMQENDRELEDMKKSYEEKLKAANKSAAAAAVQFMEQEDAQM